MPSGIEDKSGLIFCDTNISHFFGIIHSKKRPLKLSWLSRLSGTEYTGNAGEDYKVSNLTYDRNGNLLTLRRGVNGGIDALTYSYGSGNSLLSVTDASPNSAGFSDGNKTGNDYTYWPDGSLRSDLNRGITQIQYNHLKLPSQLRFSSGKVVSLRYDAQGTKLSLSSTVSGATSVRDYVGGVYQYLTPAGGSRVLAEIAHEEGRYTPAGGYEYYLKDHLGNTRLAMGSLQRIRSALMKLTKSLRCEE